jgi:hypothetical protein
MRNHLLTFALVASVAACGPQDLPREEITEVLFPSKGLLAGYDFGDSWQDIKAKPPEHFAVRDDDTKQLRRDVGDNAGSNGYYVGFGLDDAGKVKSLSVRISGKKQNAVTVRALLDDVIAHYDKTIGKGRCTRAGTKDNSSNCSWEAPGKPRVRVTYHEMLDLLSGSLEVSLTPPK